MKQMQFANCTFAATLYTTLTANICSLIENMKTMFFSWGCDCSKFVLKFWAKM